MADPVQQIKERVSIVEIIGQYVKLTKAGKNYKGLSPFKKEKTPSFYVNPDKGMYYDFSSGQGGDIFSFVQAMEGLDFKGALHMLADRAGVEVRHESRAAKDARERMYDVLEEACRLYETKLGEATQHMEYLRTRGLEDATIRRFRLGFAPDDWRTLSDHLARAGYTEHELEQAGLAKRGERGSYYDRFRSRITFPIMDPAGRVVAFSGRIVGPAAEDKENAKYLNSPETELFDKGRILYGYDKAKNFIRKYDFSIVVEGQMDLVLSHQAGYANTVAASGTGLTDDHVALLERLSKNVVLAFDADSAGVASTGRAAVLALRRGMDVKVARVPLGKDPADCIREDVEAWKSAVREAKHVVDFYIDLVLREHDERGGEERALVLHTRDTVLPLVARMASATDQAFFIRKIAGVLGIDEAAVWSDMRAVAQRMRREEQQTHTVQQAAPARTSAARTRTEDLEQNLVGFMFWQEQVEPRILEEETVQSLIAQYRIPIEALLARHAEARERLSFQAELLHAEADNPHEVLGTLAKELSREYLLAEREALAKQLRDAERAHDDEKAAELFDRFRELARCIEALE